MNKATKPGRTGHRYWLMKSEPDVFSFEDLKSRRHTRWDGVRNYMARNYMVHDMKPGDLVLFYHSNADPSGVAGIARVSAPALPDETAFDPKSEYYDARSTRENPRWHCVEVEYEESVPRLVSLEEIKREPKLKNMVLLHNSRLSVQPMTEAEFQVILKMAARGALSTRKVRGKT